MTKYDYFTGSFTENVIDSFIFVLIGTIGHGLVIYNYFKKNTHSARYFLVLILSCLDLTACYMFSLFKIIQDFNVFNLSDTAFAIIFRIRMGSTRFVLRGNLCLLCLMAIDRTMAIKRPFTYPAFRKRLPLVVAITLLLGSSQRCPQYSIWMIVALLPHHRLLLR